MTKLGLVPFCQGILVSGLTAAAIRLVTARDFDPFRSRADAALWECISLAVLCVLGAVFYALGVHFMRALTNRQRRTRAWLLVVAGALYPVGLWPVLVNVLMSDSQASWLCLLLYVAAYPLAVGANPLAFRSTEHRSS